MANLSRYVHVNGSVYGPGDTVPADVAKLITNPKAWAASAPAAAAEATAAPAAAPAPAAPVPQGTPDEEWTVRELRDYAKANGITLGEAKTKDAILDVLNGGSAPAAGTEVEADGNTGGDGQEDPAGEGDGDDSGNAEPAAGTTGAGSTGE